MKLRNLIEQFKAERACYTKNEQSGFLSEISLEIIKANLTRRELIQVFGELAALGILVSPQNVEAFINLNLLRKKTTSGGSDSYWDQVVLSLHGDVSPLIDAKGHTLTINGSTARSTTTKKFGAGSIYFSGGDSIDLDGSNDFVFYTGDFTIEFWYLPQDISSTRIIYDSRPDATQGLYPTIYHEATSLRFFTNSSDQIVGTTPLVLGSWHHISLCRSNGVTQLFLNGKPEGSSYADTNNYLNGASRVRFGTNGFNGFNGIVGYLDDIRVTKGVARYTSDFSNSGDAYWGNVVLYMPMDGADNGTTFTDVKEKSITVFGNTVTKTAIKKYGTASAYFDGTGDYLSIADSADWDLGAGDFTIECWIYMTTIPGAGTYPGIVGQHSSAGGNRAWSLFVHADLSTIYFAYTTDGTNYNYVNGGSIAGFLNTWKHIAVCRTGTTARIYVDGVGGVLNTTIGASTIYNSTLSLVIGRYLSDSDSNYFTGYIDDLRITKGVARYTAEFCSSLDPYWSNVVLHTPMDGANNGTTFVDLKRKFVNVYGNTATKTATKKYGTASAYFDGTGDYLSVADSADWDFGSGDFTIECWVYMTVLPGAGAYPGLISQQGSAGNRAWTLFVHGDLGSLYFAYTTDGTTYAYMDGGSAAGFLNTWKHIAVCRTGTTAKVYVDGVGGTEHTAIGASSIYNSTVPLVIGRYVSDVDANYLTGYIDDLRITKGVARYTGNFTPPTEANPASSINLPAAAFSTPDFPHTTFTSTNSDGGQPVDAYWNSVVLALHMDGLNNGTIFHDEKGKTVTVNGNAKTVTATKKFGMSSAYFDGTGDYLVVDGAGDFLFGTGDITIEFWLYLPSTNPLTLQIILDFRGSGLGEIFVKYDGGVIHLVSGQVTPLSHTNTGAVALESWYHVAFTLQSSVFSSYLNGVKSAASSIDSAAAFNPTNLVIGAVFGGGDYYLNGYIDDLRITKGVARYTSNFSPPTRAFPRK